MTSGSSVTTATVGTPPARDGLTPILPHQLRVEKVAFYHVAPYLMEAHYLHRKSSIPKICFAVFHEWRCVGVLVFGQPVARLEDQVTTLELNRFWLSDECAKNSESRVLSVACRLVKRFAPHIKRVVAYSDDAMGHKGIIYKACGWSLTSEGRIDTWQRNNRVRRNPRVMGAKRKWEVLI